MPLNLTTIGFRQTGCLSRSTRDAVDLYSFNFHRGRYSKSGATVHTHPASGAKKIPGLGAATTYPLLLDPDAPRYPRSHRTSFCGWGFGMGARSGSRSYPARSVSGSVLWTCYETRY